MIVDDHSIVRVGLKQVLEQSGEFEVVGEVADGEDAVRVAAAVSPDVVMMDVMMPKKDGVVLRQVVAEEAGGVCYLQELQPLLIELMQRLSSSFDLARLHTKVGAPPLGKRSPRLDGGGFYLGRLG